MAKSGKHPFTLIALVVAMLSGAPHFAQESVASQASDEAGSDTGSQTSERTTEQTGEQTRSRVLYIDLPIPIQANQGAASQVDSFLSTAQEAANFADIEQDPDFIRRNQNIAEYQGSIESIELEGGAWDQALVEELTSIGLLQQEQGNHPEAVRTFDRAMHLNRINNGLYTLQQVEVIERMIESYLALGNWEQADLYNNYLFYLQQKAFGPDDPRIIPVLNRLGSWNVQAFNLGYGDSLGIRLSSAQLFFNAAVRLVGRHFGREDERFVPYLENIARAAYLVSMNPEYIQEMDRIEFRNSQDNLKSLLNETSSIVPIGYSAGRNALQEIVNVRKEGGYPVEDTAVAITNLADWYLMFSQRDSARALYLEAWELLAAEANAAELLARFFGQVQLIPAFSKQPINLAKGSADARNTAGLESATIDLRFAVTANGEVRRIEVIDDDSEIGSSHLSRIRRAARNMNFRPVIESGVPVSSEGHAFRFRYWY